MIKNPLLKNIGVYGFELVEPVVLAGLITEDPLLLIGNSGTGKTFLLNSLSEAMSLEHRHYNASLISFDDLIGFPYPTPDHETVKYLETPATIWGAESVLIDEISRCRPEHQNRLFSLIQERRVQGLLLERLRYRWAAMNPCSMDQGVHNLYEGSVPLDQALADRFAFIIEVPDWEELNEETQKLIADPRGDGVISDDGGIILQTIEKASHKFQEILRDTPDKVIDYCRIAATVLGESEFRISPRRVRQIARNLIAISAIDNGAFLEKNFLLTLRWSIPHRAWGVRPEEEVIRSAHRTAWDATFLTGKEKWLNDFQIERNLSKKVKKLLTECPDQDTGTLAITQFLGHETPERIATLVFSLYPMALKGEVHIGKEGINELGKVANEILDLKGEIHWQERRTEKGTQHPEYARLSKILSKFRGPRRERATQLFYYLLLKNITLTDPDNYEEEFNECIAVIRNHTKT